MQRKYGVLRIVATIYKVLAWIILVVGVLGGCLTVALGVLGGAGARGAGSALGVAVGGVVGGLVGGIGIILAAVLYFLFLYAFGELVYLLIALEENTRLTAERLASSAPAKA